MSSTELPKLWTTSSKFAKVVLSKSFFGIKNQPKLSDFFSVKNIWLGDQLLWIFLKTSIFKVLCFLMMCPMFVWTLFIILVGLTMSVMKCLFPIDAYVVRCPTWSKNLGRYLIRTIRHLSRSWQKNGCMYGSLTYSSLVLLTSFPWSFTVCIHTYFLIPFCSPVTLSTTQKLNSSAPATLYLLLNIRLQGVWIRLLNIPSRPLLHSGTFTSYSR